VLCCLQGALRPCGALRRPAALARLVQPALGCALKALPCAGTFLLRPKGPKALEQNLPAGLRVDDQHLDAAVRGAMRGPGGEAGVEVIGVAGPLANGYRVGRPQLDNVPFRPREHLVAIVELAEDLLEVSSAPPRDLGGSSEAELGGLEHVAQPLRGDAHVVSRADLVPLERLGRKRPKLVEPDPYDSGGVLVRGPSGSSFFTLRAFIAPPPW
jgi:hypothetical protein